MSGPWLGVLADDVTGAGDVASALVAEGVRVAFTFGPPDAEPAGCDAVVVALKTRNLPARHAVADMVSAAAGLRALGVHQLYFKYCSTFDSTDDGNIGPVTDALLTELGAPYSLTCPATPAIGRTVYSGHLFIGNRLLSESSLRHHPLTPMTDSDLVRVLARQTPATVASLSWTTVAAGVDAVRSRLERLHAGGARHVLADALTDADLAVLGAAVSDHPLVAGAAGLAAGLARVRGGGTPTPEPAPAGILDGPEIVLAGSCSAATQEQVAWFAERGPTFLIDPLALAAGQDVVGEALGFTVGVSGMGPAMIHATTDAGTVRAAQQTLGAGRAAALVEDAMARIASGLLTAGVRKFIVAGGETSGAVVRALGVQVLRVGRVVDPGVPWMYSTGMPPLALLLKSGNLGRRTLFLDAWRELA